MELTPRSAHRRVRAPPFRPARTTPARPRESRRQPAGVNRFLCSSGVMAPSGDLFNSPFAPVLSPYQFEPIKYPDYVPLAMNNSVASTATLTPPIVAPVSPRTPGSLSESGSEPTGEECRSAFTPLRSLLPQNVCLQPSSPDRNSRRPSEGIRNEFKASSVRVSQRVRTPDRTPSPIKPACSSPKSSPIAASTPMKVWRPY